MWNSLVFGWRPAPDYFQDFMSNGVGQILSEHNFTNVPNVSLFGTVHLDFGSSPS